MSILALAWLMLSPAVALPSVNESSLPRLIQDYEGQVVVLNFWATWCGPCREEFPYFVALDRARRDQGLVVLTISMDEPEDAAKAEAFLEKQGAEFPSYIRGFDDFEKFVNSIDPSWMGTLPATFVFDRLGKLRFRQFGEITRQQLNDAVDPLLAK